MLTARSFPARRLRLRPRPLFLEQLEERMAPASAASADMSVVITGPAFVQSGASASYTITLTNNGPDAAQGVVLSNTVSGIGSNFSGSVTPSPNNPDSFTFSATNSGQTANETATADIASGNVDVFVTVITPSGSLANGTVLTSTSSVTATTADPDSSNDSSAVSTTIVQPTDLAVTETGPATVTVGAAATYTLSLTNNGPATAYDVVLSDTVSGITAAQFSGSITPAMTNPDRFTLSITNNATTVEESASGPIASGNVDVFTIVISLNNNVSSGTVLTSAASATMDNANSNPSDATTSVSSTVTTLADLAVTVSGPTTVTAGTSATYTISLTNNGPSEAQSVLLSDALPAGLTLSLEEQVNGPDSFTDTSTGNTASFTAATVSSGSTDVFQLITAASSSVIDGTALSDTAVVSSNTTDPVSGNNSDTSSSSVTTSADLALTASGPSLTTAGTNVSYTISLTNDGPSDAVTVALTDALPTGLMPVSEMQLSGPDSFTDTTSGTTFDFSAATVASGNTDVFLLVAHVASGVADGALLQDFMSATAATSDPTSNNNDSSVSTAVTTSANLTITDSGPATAAAGAKVTYTISVTNNGPSDAKAVSVTDALPAGLSLVSERQLSGPDAFTDTSSGNNPSFSATTMVGGNTDVFEVVGLSGANLAAGTVLTDTATVQSATLDPVSGDNTSSVNTTVSASAGLNVTNSGPATVTAGTNITYTISLTNGGPSDAQSVTLTDALPAGLIPRSKRQHEHREHGRLRGEFDGRWQHRRLPDRRGRGQQRGRRHGAGRSGDHRVGDRRHDQQ